MIFRDLRNANDNKMKKFTICIIFQYYRIYSKIFQPYNTIFYKISLLWHLLVQVLIPNRFKSWSLMVFIPEHIVFKSWSPRDWSPDPNLIFVLIPIVFKSWSPMGFGSDHFGFIGFYSLSYFYLYWHAEKILWKPTYYLQWYF